jgi:hypothetical protein
MEGAIDVESPRRPANRGGLVAEGAHAHVNEVIKSHRYVRDVY